MMKKMIMVLLLVGLLSGVVVANEYSYVSGEFLTINDHIYDTYDMLDDMYNQFYALSIDWNNNKINICDPNFKFTDTTLNNRIFTYNGKKYKITGTKDITITSFDKSIKILFDFVSDGISEK